MPIYEYYCPDNHTIYQFFAKTLAQGKIVPKCPDNAAFKMRKVVSAFAVTSGGKKSEENAPAGTEGGGQEDARMEAAMNAMESEFSSIDENDPRAMGRMMRRMAELTGEKIDGQMEEVVRKLEEGADPDSLDEQLGDSMGDEGDGAAGGGAEAGDAKEKKHRYKMRQAAPRRDPRLYDYE